VEYPQLCDLKRTVVKVSTNGKYFHLCTPVNEGFLLSSVELRVVKVELRIANVELQVGKVELRVANVKLRVGKVELRVANVESRVGKVEL